MKKILVFIFILTFLISCQLGNSALNIDNSKKNSKAKVTFSGKANNGICINCSQ